MATIENHIYSSRLQVMSYGILALFILALSGVEILSGGAYFTRFLGSFAPIIIVLAGVIVGGITILMMLYKYSFFFINPSSDRLKGYHFFWIIGFAFVAILVDCVILFPEDTNTPFPHSLYFYPVMGFIVEVLFHLLPLTYLMIISDIVLANFNEKIKIWLPILLIATLEPTFQAAVMGPFPTWAIVVTWVNIYLFNVFQLYAYWKFDFISMFLLRMVYYLLWHIGWGNVRLELLF